MRTRLARQSDVPAICRLIQIYADQGVLLPRTEAEVRSHLGHFLVLTANSPAGAAAAALSEKLLGCVALEPYGADLAEIRSLAVEPKAHSLGLGGRLLEAALGTARRRKIARVFAVTHAAPFFERHGFVATSRQALPEKIARDCNGCPKARNCSLVALVVVVCPERITQPALAPTGKVSGKVLVRL
jgi:N-acetylglutamate synthase-like GNAT family acetyltransferase